LPVRKLISNEPGRWSRRFGSRTTYSPFSTATRSGRPEQIFRFGPARFYRRISAPNNRGSRHCPKNRIAAALAAGAVRVQFAAMCGRARLSSDVSEIKLVFSIPPERAVPNFPATWNLAPTDPLPIVRYDPRTGERSLEVMRWGLVPYWAKDVKIGYSTFNAKAEGIDARPAFREPFARRRCLVPLNGFYEWKKRGKDRQPYAAALADRPLMAMAGLWDIWRSPSDERVRSFTIITTEPNELLAPLHDRMPVILRPESWPLWLGEASADAARLKALLVPYPSDDMVIWPVSTRVGNVKNNDASLIEPVALPEP
jgi:putative SOS response-associated peptidase YedK